jgi:hypothetical protein
MADVEEELLRRYVAGGDADAFGELVESHEGMVYSVCRRVLGNVRHGRDGRESRATIPVQYRNGQVD